MGAAIQEAILNVPKYDDVYIGVLNWDPPRHRPQVCLQMAHADLEKTKKSRALIARPAGLQRFVFFPTKTSITRKLYNYLYLMVSCGKTYF
jgi:hypothetical protein